MKSEFLRALGPGIIFAGAAIGTSHLVQSTRAGALYGLGFLGVIIFANLIKYPAFRFGPYYTAVTGRSLIEGYRPFGKVPLALLGVGLTIMHIIIIAATGITAAGIAVALFGLTVDARYLGAGLIVLAGLITRVGGYQVLDGLTKLFVAVLTIATVLATLLVLPEVSWNITFEPFASMNPAVFAFAVAVMGFMPSALDLSIVNSLWAKAKQSVSTTPVTMQLRDFNIGYIGTAILAVCFLLMGAGVMHTAGTVPVNNAGQFAGQVIGLYTASLGAWSGMLVGVSALAVMFTTLLAVLDGLPRSEAAILEVVLEQEGSSTRGADAYQTILQIVMALGAILVLLTLMGSFTTFIDFVTITSFLVGPLIAFMNHRVVFSDADHAPGQALWVWSWVGILSMTAIALAYFASRF